MLFRALVSQAITMLVSHTFEPQDKSRDVIELRMLSVSPPNRILISTVVSLELLDCIDANFYDL